MQRRVCGCGVIVARLQRRGCVDDGGGINHDCEYQRSRAVSRGIRTPNVLKIREDLR